MGMFRERLGLFLFFSAFISFPNLYSIGKLIMSKPKKVEKKKYKYVLQEDGKWKPILVEKDDKKEKENG